MNKKVPVIVAIVIVLCLVGGVLFMQLKKPAGNPSRRDGQAQNMDEDLSAVDGSGQLDDNRVAPVPPKDTSNQLNTSVIEEDANKPLADDVQVVRKVTIPEAVIMGSGDEVAFYANEDFKDVVPVDVAAFTKEDIPAKYDSRDVDGKRYVTTVEDQGYSYLCWTYACMGAIESDILRHHPQIGYTDIDLSEKHLAYYNMHKAEGSVGGYQDEDYRELVNADDIKNDWIFDYDSGYVTVGGVTDFCIGILGAWKGPVAEQGDDSFNSLYGSSNIFSDNGNAPSAGYTSDYHVQGTYEVPGDIEHNLRIKQLVMEHGAATIGVNADSIYWNDHNKKLYSCFGGGNVETANHEVLVVGWDDEYSASNFRQAPPADGAWLCRNSWGTSSGDQGFFYLSYYDETTAISNAAAYSVACPGDSNWYDNNYQAAGFFTNVVSTLDDSLNTITAYSGSTNPYGIMYEAQKDETLKAVGFMSIDMYQQYELEIYLNPDDSDDNIAFKTQDDPVLSQKISAISAGYHTFELDEAIDLARGDKFFILIKPVTEGRLVFDPERDETSDANYDEWQNFTGNIHNSSVASGLSYYISDDGLSMERQTDKDFFIKAFTNDK